MLPDRRLLLIMNSLRFATVVSRQFFLLPGMGATSAMHHGLANAYPNLRHCEWPRDLTWHSFTELADYFIEHHQITDHDIVGGSSMGGMIAAEIAARINAKDLVLIGSCTHPQAIWAHKLSAIAAAAVPLGMMSSIPLARSSCQLAAMAESIGTPFIRCSLRALRQWQGAELRPTTVIHAIHGCLDPIISVHRVPAQVRIPWAGHIIAMSHSPQICLFIGQRLS